MPDKPGFYKGKHISEYVPEIINLKREDRYNDFEFLLYKLVEATEADYKANGYGVAPFYYEELAILYRKQKDYKREIDILERFISKKHALGVKPAQLEKRLEKAKELLAKGK